MQLNGTGKQRRLKEKMHHQTLIQALSSDYDTVLCVDLDKNFFEIIRIQESIAEKTRRLISESNDFTECARRYIGEIVYEPDRKKLREIFTIEVLRTILTDRDSFSMNYQIVRDARTCYYRVKCARVGDKNNFSRIILGFHEAEEEIRREKEHQQVLADALKQAESANQAKTVFLNNISHDMRTPMNAILGFTMLASSHLDDRELVKDYLEKIEHSSKHLLSLINDVLDMSRIESGKISLEKKTENLSEILQGILNMVQVDIQEKHLKLYTDISGIQDVYIRCDKLQLNRIFINLLSNAIKFTNPGGRISLTAKQIRCPLKGHASYKFSVKDSGIGMSKEFTEHIFDAFSRERTSTVSGIQGTGLGMSITRSLVEMMGGNISVNSELGKGTEFLVTFTFKIKTGKLQTGEKKVDVDSEKNIPEKVQREEDQRMKKEQQMDSIKGKRILLAEDNELNSEIAVTILSEAGAVMETAENGKDAYELVKQSKPGYYDLVLMDIQMPVMNGYDSVKAIRALDNKELSNIPVIAMTASAFEEDKRKALETGMNGHVAKPINVDELFETIHQVTRLS